MEMSADGSHSSDLQKQLGLRHIVNIQGPFFQRGPNDCGGDQQKNQTTTASSASSADNNEMQGSTFVRKTALRVGAAIAEGQLLAGNNSAQHRPEQMSNLQQQSSHHTKHLVDEVDEEEDDDGDADPSVRISNSEQTGRWTRKEHEVFLEALKKFGKEWKKVASMVKTRTVVQTRTHAQKYFQKVSKSGGGEDSENENDATEESAVKAVPFLNDRTATVSNKSSSPSKVSNESPTSNFFKGSKGMEAMCDGYIVKSPARDDVTASQVKQNPYGYHAYAAPSSGYPTIGGDAHENDPYAPLWSGKRKHFELTSTEVLEGQPYPSKISDGSNKWNWSSSTHPYPGTGRDQVRIGRIENNHDNSNSISNSNSNSSGSNGVFPSSLSNDYLMDMEGEGAQVLSMMKEMNETILSVPSDQSHHTHTAQKMTTTQSGRNKGSNSAPPSLKIFNPESINHYAGGGGGGCSDNQDAPDTPWESEVRALEARIAFLPRATSVGESENSDAPHLQKFSTPSEQRDFMKRVTTLLDRGFRGVAALEALLSAAASAAATNVLDDSDGEISKLKEGNGSALACLSRALNRADPAGCTALMHACSPIPPSDLGDNEEDEEDVESGEESAESCEGVHENLILTTCTLLMKYGASSAASDITGSTCIHRVAFLGLTEVGKLLLAGGCPIDALNVEGDAATHIAAREGHGTFLQMLSSMGANCHLRSAQSRSPLDLINHTSHSTREHLRRILLTAEPRLRTLILHHEDCLVMHSAKGEWEDGDRLERIMKVLTDPLEFASFELEVSSDFKRAGVELLGRVHSPAYIARVDALSKQSKKDGLDIEKEKDKDTTTDVSAVDDSCGTLTRRERDVRIEHSLPNPTPAILQAARRATGSVAYAIDRVLCGKNRNAFCVVRPPGHHAGYDGFTENQSTGFCVFNSVAAGALHALDEEGHGVQRVAIIDLDIHHGSGTEDIVRRYPHPSRLFFFCLHLFDEEHSAILNNSSENVITEHSEISSTAFSHLGAKIPVPDSDEVRDVPLTQTSKEGYTFFPGTGKDDDTEHNIINVPLCPLWRQVSCTDTDTYKECTPNQSTALHGRLAYRRAIVQRLIPALRAFSPGLIIISAGFDGAQGDVGNTKPRHCKSGQSENSPGMDLRPSDFEWITTEIMRIADLCCSGRVVSVLEGGYGTHTIKRTHTDEKEKEKEREKEKEVVEEVEVEGVVKVEVEMKDASALLPSLDSLPSCTISDTSLLISLSIPSLASIPDSNSDTLSDSHTESESPPVDTPPHSGKKTTHCRSGMDRDVLAMSVAAHVRRLVDPYGPHVRINSTSPTPPIDTLSSCAPSSLPPTAASPILSHSISLPHPITALTPTSASVPASVSTPVPVPSSSSANVTSNSSLHSLIPGPSHLDTQSQLSSQPLCATKVLPYIDVEDSNSESLHPSKEKIIGLQNDDFIEAAQCSLSITQEGQQFQSPT